ncbi:MAG: hypothetical protein NTW21_17070 [Verrucomicrobia bacterium]|nr:hypothetical protein [Verrucomicrobiota bacterium]
MSACPTSAAAKRSLTEHVADMGAALRAKYGPRPGWRELQQVLLDRSLVRYPCEIAFTTEGLRDGEFAYPQPKGATPEEGFVIRIHPLYMTELEWVPHLVFYQLVAVNYGDFASAEDAETFGAAALGLEPEAYYHTICRLADQLGGGGCG